MRARRTKRSEQTRVNGERKRVSASKFATSPARMNGYKGITEHFYACAKPRRRTKSIRLATKSGTLTVLSPPR